MTILRQHHHHHTRHLHTSLPLLLPVRPLLVSQDLRAWVSRPREMEFQRLRARCRRLPPRLRRFHSSPRRPPAPLPCRPRHKLPPSLYADTGPNLRQVQEKLEF